MAISSARASGPRKAPRSSHVEPYRPEVKAMQLRMKRAGVNPGPIDGLKGPLTRRAMREYEKRFGRSAADGPSASARPARIPAGVDARSPATEPGARSNLELPGNADRARAAPAAGDLDAGSVKDGHALPSREGKATTFWNGHYLYKGQRDTANMSKGAWGDSNRPVEYFAALPVGLAGGGNWWHNQKLLITNPRNGRQVVVRVQDKGPHPKTGAAIDLSPVAKEALGVGFMDNLNVKISFARDDAAMGAVR